MGGGSSPRAVSLYARAPGARPSGDVKVRATRNLNGGPDCSVAKRTRPVPAACKKTPYLDAVRCGATRRPWGIQRAGCTTIVHAVTLSIGYWDNVDRQMDSRKAARGKVIVGKIPPAHHAGFGELTAFAKRALTAAQNCRVLTVSGLGIICDMRGPPLA